MKKQNLFLCLALSFLLFNCGKGLNDEQKGVFFGTVNSAGKGVSASSKEAKQNQTRNQFEPSDVYAASEIDEIDPLEGYLRNSQAECDWSFNQTQSSMGMAAKISGANCPLEFDMKVQAKEMGMDMDIHYLALTDAMKELNDVFGLDFKFTVSASGNKGKFSASGKILSTDYGQVEIDGKGKFSGNENGGKGEVQVNFKFEDFTAKLKIKGSESGIEYSLNGEKMTEEELSEKMSDLIDVQDDLGIDGSSDYDVMGVLERHLL